MALIFKVEQRDPKRERYISSDSLAEVIVDRLTRTVEIQIRDRPGFTVTIEEAGEILEWIGGQRLESRTRI